jgi:transposase
MSKRYTEEFRAGAVKQVLERGHSAKEVSDRLGLSPDTMFRWLRVARKPRQALEQERLQGDEVQRLKAELRRVTEERDILKKAAAYFAKGSG